MLCRVTCAGHRRLAGIVFGHGPALLASHTGGQFFSRKGSGLRGQCEERLAYCADARFLDVDSGQALLAPVGRHRQGVELPCRQEAQMSRLYHG